MKSSRLIRPSRFFAALLLVWMVSGCAFKPKTPEQQAKNSINYAVEAARKGEARNVQINIDYVTMLQGQAHHITKLFQSDPDASLLYISGAAQYIDSITYPSQIAMERDSLSVLRSVEALPAVEIDALDARVADRALAGNLAGKIPFMLHDKMHGLGLLESPDHMGVILERTVNYAKTAAGPKGRQIAEIMAYISSPATPQKQKSFVEMSLDSIPITKPEMETYVRPVFPMYVKEKLANMTVKAAFVYSGADRLAQDDLLSSIKGRVKGVEWQQDAGKGVITIKIDRIRHNERTEPPRTETIRYSQHQVNFLASALLMPHNATYSYSLTRSAVEVDYGYEISVLNAGKTTHTEIVRGNVRSESASCSDAAIQNVFGGTSAAGFVANDDMATRCNTTGSRTIADLRNEIDSKIVDAILRAPTIGRVHQLNL